MTPEAAALLSSLVDRFGLPVAILAILGYLILSGRLVTGSQLATMTTLYERERADRIAAEANLAKFAGANAEVAEAVREVLTEIVNKDHYQERLAPPRRGR